MLGLLTFLGALLLEYFVGSRHSHKAAFYKMGHGTATAIATEKD